MADIKRKISKLTKRKTAVENSDYVIIDDGTETSIILMENFLKDYAHSSDVTSEIEKLDNAKVDKVDGKGLSTNDFTDEYKANIEENNKKISNVQADWNATEGLAVILNKPTDLGKVDDVKVDGVSVVTDKIANIDLTGKQDKLIAGQNITIDVDGKTINASDYSIVKDENPGDFAAVYHLTKNGLNVGTAIEIEKSQVLKKASVKTCVEKDVPIEGLNVGDKYIDFEWANGTHSYANLKDLTDIYKADEETLTLSADNVFSVKAVSIDLVTGLQDVIIDIKDGIDNLNKAITAEATAREEADKATNARIDAMISEKLPVISGKTLLCNGVSVRIEDDGTQNIAHYFTVDNDEKTIAFPYEYSVYGGGVGTSQSSADFESTMIVVNGGILGTLYGGSAYYGTIGTVTMIINGGTIKGGIVGGGYAGIKYNNNTVGNIIMKVNGGTSSLLFAGGHGYGTVGNVDFEFNGGSYDYVTVGGSNGVTGVAKAIINGGSAKVFQTVNRGYIHDVKVEVNGGNIDNFYAGGETGDASVTGKAEKVVLDINNSFNGILNKGSYNGVEDASRCSGEYVYGAITEKEALMCNLTEKILILDCNIY